MAEKNYATILGTDKIKFNFFNTKCDCVTGGWRYGCA